MTDFESNVMFGYGPGEPIDEEMIEHGAETIYAGIVPYISHQTGEFDPSGYIAGYQETRRQLMENSGFIFTEAVFDRCLMMATEWAEDYVQQLRAAAIEEQLHG